MEYIRIDPYLHHLPWSILFYSYISSNTLFSLHLLLSILTHSNLPLFTPIYPYLPLSFLFTLISLHLTLSILTHSNLTFSTFIYPLSFFFYPYIFIYPYIPLIYPYLFSPTLIQLNIPLYMLNCLSTTVYHYLPLTLSTPTYPYLPLCILFYPNLFLSILKYPNISFSTLYITWFYISKVVL